MFSVSLVCLWWIFVTISALNVAAICNCIVYISFQVFFFNSLCDFALESNSISLSCQFQSSTSGTYLHDSRKKTIWFPLHSEGTVSFSRNSHAGLQGFRTWEISCSPFPIDLLCSLQYPTMMSGPDLPGPSWRFVLIELIARRKAPWSYLPSGSEPPPPQPPPSPSRARHRQCHSHSVSIQY